jgi:putative ABC transport system permease protein
VSGLGRVVRAGVRRRRLTTVAVGLAVLMAVTAAVLGASLLVASAAPFDRAFAGQHGAHLTAQFDAAKLSPAQAAGTARVAGVTAAAGPFPVALATPQDAAPLTLVGRAGPGGAVDDVALTDGRWPAGPGEIVLGSDAPYTRTGGVLRFPGLPGSPAFTVVGHARSVSRTADAWVTPAALTAPTGYQMLYRFADAGTDTQVDAARGRIAAAVPAGALTGARSWLVVRQDADRNTGIFVPFLTAFGVLALVMAVLIIGTVVTGAIGANIRRIGVLKALGCTPVQVTRAYAGQALIPATAGAGLGVVAGNALAVPVLAETNSVYGTASSGVAPGTDLLVVAGVLAVVAVAAIASAWRAGRLRTVQALALGQRPVSRHGRAAAWIAARVPGPPQVGLGLSRPCARPARAGGLIAAGAFGAATVTFALGLAATTADVAAAKNHDLGAVLVRGGLQFLRGGQQPGTPPSPKPITGTPAQIGAAIAAQPGTRSYYARGETSVAVAGMSGTSDLYTFGGDASDAGYQMVTGRWFRGAGEAVAVSTFLRETGTRVGGTVTLQAQGRTVAVRIVGEVFDPHTDPEVLVDAATFPDLAPDSYYVTLRPGTNTAAYLAGLRTAVTPYGMQVLTPEGTRSGTLLALNVLTGLLAVMLVVIAGLGVLNNVVLDTRDRTHDIGVCKALGMTPRQATAMVLTSVLPAGLAGGLLGVPTGVALYARTAPAMGHAAGLNLPAQAVNVLHRPELAALVVAGLLIAVLGAALPAGWAARTRTATALRTE